MTPIEWLLSDDTGTSSMTICAVMIGSRIDDTDVPHDPGDFGRCHRLLLAFPEWRARLPEVSAKYPEWAPLVHEWDSLTAQFVAGESEGWMTPRMYERMRELIEDGRLSAGWTNPSPGCWEGPNRAL